MSEIADLYNKSYHNNFKQILEENKQLKAENEELKEKLDKAKQVIESCLKYGYNIPFEIRKEIFGE